MRFFYRVLNAEQGEVSSILLFLILGFCLGSITAFSEIASVSLSIHHVRIDQFPFLFMIAGVVTIGATHLYSTVHNWVPPSALAFFSIAILFIGDLFIFYSYRIAITSWIIYIIFSIAFVKTAVLAQLFWSFFYTVYDSTQIRRLHKRGEAGLVIGSILSLLFISFFLSKKNLAIEYYFLISGLLTAFAGGMIIKIATKILLLNKISSNVQYIREHNNYKTLLYNPYSRSIAIFLILSGLCIGLINYFFFSIVKLKYETVKDTVEYLSIFCAVLLLLGFILSITVREQINNKYGYRLTILILPVALSLFAAVYCFMSYKYGFKVDDDSFYLLFMIMAICKLLYTSLSHGFEFTTLRAYFIPIEAELRLDFQNKMEGFFKYSGIALVGVLSLIFLWGFSISFASFSFFLLPVSIIWIISCFKLHKWYRITLKDSLAQKDIVTKNNKAINSYVERLVYSSTQLKSYELPKHLAILNILDPIEYKKAIMLLLDSEDDEVQQMALYEADSLCLLASIPILETIQKSKFYPISKNRELIRKTYQRLKGAEFRLEKVKYIEQLTFSKIIKERRFGALLSSYSDPGIKSRLLNKLFRDPDYKVRYNAVQASAQSETSDLHNNLIEKLGDTAYSNAAVSAIIATGEIIFPLLESAFYLTGQSEKVQLRIVQIYSRIANDKSVALLTKKLNYTNRNIVDAVIDGLSKCKINVEGSHSIRFRREIEEVCNLIVWNMSAYNDLYRYGATSTLLTAMKFEIQSNYDALFKLLALIYDPNSVSLVRENINSGNPDKTEFASELLEVFVAEEIKPMLLPIMSVDSYDSIIWKMQEYFPVDSMTYQEVLYDLIQRDYQYTNRWTKACALQELVLKNNYKNLDIFIANLVNPDAMMRETAAVLLHKINPVGLKYYLDRFKKEFNIQSGKEIISKNILSAITEQQHSPALKFEMVRFLNEVNEFKAINGVVLIEIAKIIEYSCYSKGEIIDQYENFDYFNYFIVRDGMVSLKMHGEIVRDFSIANLIHTLDYLNTEEKVMIELEAKTDCAVYKIKQEYLHELISLYEEVPKSILAHEYSNETLTALYQ